MYYKALFYGVLGLALGFVTGIAVGGVELAKNAIKNR